MGIISAMYIAALVASRSINERQKCLENAGNKGKKKETLSSKKKKKTKPVGVAEKENGHVHPGSFVQTSVAFLALHHFQDSYSPLHSLSL